MWMLARRPSGQSDRSELVTTPQFDDPTFHAVRRLGRAASGATGAVLEAGDPSILVAPPPFVGSLAGDPHGLGGGSHRPALLDHVAEAQSAFWGEWSITVHNEPPGGCVGV